jgi:hypothetical protein
MQLCRKVLTSHAAKTSPHASPFSFVRHHCLFPYCSSISLSHALYSRVRRVAYKDSLYTSVGHRSLSIINR